MISFACLYCFHLVFWFRHSYNYLIYLKSCNFCCHCIEFVFFKQLCINISANYPYLFLIKILSRVHHIDNWSIKLRKEIIIVYTSWLLCINNHLKIMRLTYKINLLLNKSTLLKPLKNSDGEKYQKYEKCVCNIYCIVNLF